MSTPSFNDALALIRRQLSNDATSHKGIGGTINAEIKGRVRGPAALDADTNEAPFPSVILDLFGGGAEYGRGRQTITVYLYAFDPQSQGRATDLYHAVYDSLQGVRLWDPEGHITAAGYAREVSRPIAGHNERTQAHYARGVWVVTLAG